MQHFSCDSCQQPIGEPRYRVVVEAALVDTPAPALTAEDLCDDNLQALAELLAAEQQTADCDPDFPCPEALTQPVRSEFDLCPACYGRYARDPLGTTRNLSRLHFSRN